MTQNPFDTVEGMGDLQRYAEFFAASNFASTNIGDYEQIFAVHSKLFVLAQHREQSLHLLQLYAKFDKDHANTLNNLANTQKRSHLKLASAYFCFNRYDLCIDHVITAWNLPVAQRANMLTILPKAASDNEYFVLLFASLFVRKGYAESLVVSQFIDSMADLRKLQRYILKFINYIPKHLMDFLISPSLIEEVLAKNSVEAKNHATENTLVVPAHPRDTCSTVPSSTK